jgi:uncharacterized protein (TIGR03437 family)
MRLLSAVSIKAILRVVLFIVTPGLAFSGPFTTALGGAYPFTVSAIATDSAGNTYVVGGTQISGTPSFGNPPKNTQTHIFVSKLGPNGNALFTDTLAGQGTDTANAIAIDPSGNIYVAGMTTSPDFPVINALQTQFFPPATNNGVPAGNGFLTKLSPDGTTILYSTFFGGTLGQSAINSLAVGANGNLYLTGYTLAMDFPHTAGMPFGTVGQNPTSPAAMIASISPSGGQILYSGAIPLVPPCNQLGTSCAQPGNGWAGVGIAVDPAGNAYIAGNGGNASLPTTPGALAPNGLGAFVAKVNAGGTEIGYLTYLGPGETQNYPYNSSWNTLYAIAVDAAGNAYLGGQTANASAFPATPGSYLPAPYNGAGGDGFLAKLNPTGSALVWATYFDNPQSIAVDAAGNLWANGLIDGVPLPNQNGWTTGSDYLVALNPAGSELIYSALYPAGTVGQALAIDASGLVHAAGLNGFVSAIAPSAAPAPEISYFGNAALSAATARVAPGEVIAIYGPGIGPATPAVATPSGGFYPTTLAGVEVSMNGVKMPLLYAGANQINAVVPMELTTNAAATVRLTNGATVNAFPVWIVPSAPMAFPVVVNHDGTLNSQTNPAKSGDFVLIYATGWQSSFAPLANGQVQITADDACQGNCTGAALGMPGIFPIGGGYPGFPVTVLYGGDAPGYVAGITQFNIQLGAVPDTGVTRCYPLSLQGPLSATGPAPTFLLSNLGVCVAP